jgi:hypothetical protein
LAGPPLGLTLLRSAVTNCSCRTGQSPADQIDHKLELLGELNRKISRSLRLIVSNQVQLLADEMIE